MSKEFSPEEKSGLFVIDELSPQLGRLLLSTSLGNPEYIDDIIDQSRSIEDRYLAYESVRTGLRAGYIVGKIYTHDKRLPYTGLEPYAVGSELSPEEIVGLEASEGVKLVKALNRDGSGYFYNKALRGEKVDPKVIGDLAAVWGGLVARFRAIGDSDLSQFRSETYSRVRVLPDIAYALKGGDLKQTIVLPKVSEGQFPTTRVELSSDDIRGYLMVSALGRFGHPLVRETVRRLD